MDRRNLLRKPKKLAVAKSQEQVSTFDNVKQKVTNYLPFIILALVVLYLLRMYGYL
jgi:hypothetical protein